MSHLATTEFRFASNRAQWRVPLAPFAIFRSSPERGQNGASLKINKNAPVILRLNAFLFAHIDLVSMPTFTRNSHDPFPCGRRRIPRIKKKKRHNGSFYGYIGVLQRLSVADEKEGEYAEGA